MVSTLDPRAFPKFTVFISVRGPLVVNEPNMHRSERREDCLKVSNRDGCLNPNYPPCTKAVGLLSAYHCQDLNLLHHVRGSAPPPPSPLSVVYLLRPEPLLPELLSTANKISIESACPDPCIPGRTLPSVVHATHQTSLPKFRSRQEESSFCCSHKATGRRVESSLQFFTDINSLLLSTRLPDR